jgi:hypothetical protein
MLNRGRESEGRVVLAGIGGAGLAGQQAPRSARVSPPKRPSPDPAAHAAVVGVARGRIGNQHGLGILRVTEKLPDTFQRWIGCV